MTQMFSEDQIAEFQEAFSLFDRDADGYITADEVGVAIRAVGGVITEAELTQLVLEITDNNKGRVDFPEFLILMSRNSKSVDDNSDNDVMLEALTMLDKTSSGVIRADLLLQVLASMGEVMTSEEAQELIKETDKEGTGMIDYKEFLKMLTL